MCFFSVGRSYSAVVIFLQRQSEFHLLTKVTWGYCYKSQPLAEYWHKALAASESELEVHI